METKECAWCKSVKPLNDFYRHETSKGGRSAHCKECHKARLRAFYAANRDLQHARQRERAARGAYRDYELRKKYGLTRDMYTDLLAAQGGVCAICRRDSPGRAKDKSFVVDHCHTSGRVRGLLCHPCNLALGALQDSEENLERAISYLRRS